jgi:MarR family transcriptional regulator, organic hydroperoxide resistance regulator
MQPAKTRIRPAKSIEANRGGAKSPGVAEQNRRNFPPLTVSHSELLRDGKDDDFRQTLYLIVQVLGQLETCRAAFGKAMGLNGSQFAVMMGVAYRQGEEGVRISNLARYVQLASTHVTTQVGRLEKMGLLSKQAGTDDRRSVLVRLTADGEKAITNVVPFLRRVNDLLFSGITSKQLSTIMEVFTKLSLNSEFAIAEVRRFERQRGERGD